MLERQRGVYQPLGKNDPIYDLSDDQVEEQAHSRLPLLEGFLAEHPQARDEFRRLR